MRLRAKRDSNEKALVELFKAHGCEVERLSMPNLPDLLVGWGWRRPRPPFVRRMALVEVKTATGTLQDGQVDFHDRFPVWVVRTAAEVEAVVAWLKA